MFAIAVNKKLGWNLDEVELGASIAVSVNLIFRSKRMVKR
jgi:hypothetical protein